MIFQLPNLRLILRAAAALALLAVFALAPVSVSLSGVAHAQSADPEPTIVNICDRTPQVRDAILANLRDVSDCAAVTDSDLNRVRRLPLYYEEITALQAGDFQGLANLERLYLDGNSLTELPDGVFNGLSNLEWLDLYGNSLTELPDGVFDGLSNLEYLYLDGNSLSELPDGVFNGLSNLEWLYLGSNDLTTLPDGVFGGLSNLEYLYLDGNSLSELPDGVFGGLSSLGTLDLRENDLTGLPDGVFDSLDSLEFLYLQSNDLTGLPDGVFDELTNLESLEFSYNDLTQLRADVFNGLSKLESLEFSYNDLTALPADVFDGLSSLENLDLKLNDLSKLPDGVFDGLSSLEDLLLGGNYLTALPAGVFNGLSNLEYLSLSANDLTALPAGVFNGLSNLEDLKLHTNDLSALPAGVFEGLSSLRSVDLQDNPGAPFTLTVELEQRGDDAFVVKVADGTPSDITVILAAQGGTLSSTTFTIHGGSVTSEEISVTPDDTGRVTIGIESVAFKRSRSYKGIQIGFGNYSLVLGAEVPANTPATGAPTISGTAQVGETLTASTSGITDADGLTGVTFSYQWLSSRDTEIQGATGASYTLVPADRDKTIKVRVTFTDDGGAEETLTSAPTAAVVAATPQGICGRTQQVQDAIIAKLNEGLDTPEVTDCAEVTAEDLRGITGELELSIEEIPALKSGDFEGLSNLNSLKMIDSGLETLPEDIFDGLTALHSLFIIGNDDLETLPEDIFDGLTGLTTLTVSGNAALSELPEDIFDGLTSLVSLSLAENSLSELPEDIFDGLTSLRLLDLHGNDLTGLPPEVFDGLANLGYIRLNENSLRALSADVFEGLSSLKQLPLEGNNLESLPDGLFEGLVSLEQVILNGNEGAPFTLTAELEEQGDGAFVVKVAEGSPFDLTVTLSARGGTLSSTTVTVEAGSLASGPVGVSVDGNGPARVTVTVESATFPEDREYFGVNTGLGQPLVLDLPGSPQGQRGDGGPEPAEAVRVTAPASVPQNAEATVTISFGGLEFDADTSDTDYIFRADVVDADACEGGGMGNDRYMYKVDEDPEVRAATISAACPPGDYTIEVSISSPADVELASATADFTVAAPAQQRQAQEPPLSIDATLSGLTLSDVTLAFASATSRYSVSVANDVTQTTVTPTVNHDGATYAIKLGGVTDGDGVIPLAVGSNAITIEVTAEDGNTAKTYTVTVTRAEPPTSRPAVAIELSPSGSVAEGTEITVTMSFANLESDTDTSDTDYIFRADVVNADACEGGGMGNDRYMYKVDEDPEVRTGTVSASCTPGDYTIEVSISSPLNVELASATADFTVNAPGQQRQTQEPPPSTDATLNGLTLSDVTLAFASATTEYTASVANDVTQTTVTPTVNDDGATHAIKLGGVTDADGVIPLAVGSNVITVEVTAEDGNTAKTYTVTVTRAAPPSADATLSDLALSGVPFTFASATTRYNVNVANGVDQTTVTATANDGEATYAVKLGGVADEDGTVELSVGSNAVSVVVTAEDGETTKTYTVTVTRAEQPASGPAATIDLSLLASVTEGTEFTVTMSFANLPLDDNANLTFRADVVGADACEGGGIGDARGMSVVDEDPETRTGTIAAACSPGDYTLEVTLTSDDNVELASATAAFSVVEPTSDPVEPEPESTGERSAWLEQNPENKPFVGEWQHFTLRGSGLDKVDLSVNVIGFGGAPSSTGAVGYATASPPGAAGEVCSSAYYSGYQMSVDSTFSLVGCREGNVIIELLDPGNGYVLLKRYTVTVNAGP